MAHKITLIPGDGIGPEISRAVVRIIEAAGVVVEWESFKAGADALSEFGKALPDDLMSSLTRTHVGLKGPTTTPIGGGHVSINVALRKAFDLYASFRPVRNLPNVESRYGDVDLVIFRENTEDLYSGLEHEVVPGVVESLKIITEKATTRIARAAFEYARKEKRKKISSVHKANIMKLSDGLFLRCVRRVAEEYPEVEYNEIIVDNCCMQLVMNPYKFDVLLMENLYGDIVSDLCAGLVGGLGIVPGANLGEGNALFEAVHGSAPDIAGKNLANPTALLQSAVLMLRHIGERDAASRIEAALRKCYEEKLSLTRDVGGTATTTEFTETLVGLL
jgi:isocitrate dehydrogenase (NAD+)